MREEIGLTLDKVEEEVLGHAAEVVLIKDTTTTVGDESSQEAVNKRVAQIRNRIEAAYQYYEKEKLNERIAKLSGGVAVMSDDMLTGANVVNHLWTVYSPLHVILLA